MAVVTEHEGGDSDPAGFAGLRGHLNTPARPPASAAKKELGGDGDEEISKTSVVLSSANGGAFPHRGRKLISSRPK